MKNKIYIIDGKTYLNHINDEVHLYGLLHQLAFLAGRIKDEEDMFHVLDAEGVVLGRGRDGHAGALHAVHGIFLILAAVAIGF